MYLLIVYNYKEKCEVIEKYFKTCHSRNNPTLMNLFSRYTGKKYYLTLFLKNPWNFSYRKSKGYSSSAWFPRL